MYKLSVTKKIMDTGHKHLESAERFLASAMQKSEVARFPMDGTPIYETNEFYVSESFKREEGRIASGFLLRKQLWGKSIDQLQIHKLMKEKETDLIYGFEAPNSSRKFNARIKLKENGSYTFKIVK